MKLVVRLAAISMAMSCAFMALSGSTSAQHYNQTNLTVDDPTTATAPHTDAHLKNPWGLARSNTSPWWVSDNATGFSTLYDGSGNAVPLVVKIPGPNGSPADFQATPTGVVFNGTVNFDVTPGNDATAAKFIFVTEDGTISAWAGGNAATLEVDNSTNPNPTHGAVYKGATIAEFNGKLYLYVTNFRSGHVEVYDTNFKQVNFLINDDRDDRFDDHFFNRFGDRFDDDRIPRGFAPFNIQNIGGSLFVTYAKQDDKKHDDVAGDGNGFVDIYTPGGKLEARLEHGPWLNSPWGAVWAPRDFGAFSNRVLIGNFGSGKIAAFDGFDGKFIGMMEDAAGNTLQIEGLWALMFGNSAIGCPATPPVGSGLPKCGAAGPYNSLFFTAGPNDESNGIFGTLTAVPAELSGDFQ